MYTTGEVAKICHVSKRTVQYYDYEGIVQPSQILEHGKRVYSKEDIQKFQLVLLYKDLGLSLKDIRYIFEQDHQDTLLIQILEQQYQKNQKQLTHLQQQNQEISVLLQELQNNHALTVFNYQELHDLIKDQKYQKTIHPVLMVPTQKDDKIKTVQRDFRVTRKSGLPLHLLPFFH